MKRVAFYGGSFDPVHDGHLRVAEVLTELFELDEFVFIPAFHAPHKRGKTVTSPVCRYAMIALATNDLPKIKISTVELNAPEKPYTFETLLKLKNKLTDAQIFFVMGADSWEEITTWREWKLVLTTVNIIVVTRPHFEIEFSHVGEEIRERVVDLRQSPQPAARNRQSKDQQIYVTDAVCLDVSATEIRQEIRAGDNHWRELVPPQVAKYIEKYELYI
ncbi:MAG: nicotinate (nicotinamide) nucleotide adenylyltransferase [Acidobacteria bacterium]|nr:nicotinate (nicotinamide) nucleotide adenylyltransferase [Acidobacteriota bacterium]